MLVEVPIQWLARPGIVQSSCGRFDLILSHSGQSWQAIDWNTGRAWRGELAVCKRWCLKQLENKS